MREPKITLSEAIWEGVQEQAAEAAISAIDSIGYGVNYLASEVMYALSPDEFTDEFSDSKLDKRVRSRSTLYYRSSKNRSSKRRSKSSKRNKSRKDLDFSWQAYHSSNRGNSKRHGSPNVALYRRQEDDRDEESEASSRVRVRSLIEKFDGPSRAETSPRRQRKAKEETIPYRSKQNLDGAMGIEEMDDSMLGSIAEDLDSVLHETYSSSGIFRPRPDSFNEDSERFGYLRVRRGGEKDIAQQTAPISPLTPFQDLHESNKRALFDANTFDTKSLSQVQLQKVSTGKLGPEHPMKVSAKRAPQKGPVDLQVDREIDEILFSERNVLHRSVPDGFVVSKQNSGPTGLERSMTTTLKKKPFRSYSPPPPSRRDEVEVENRTNLETHRSNSIVADQREAHAGGEANSVKNIQEEIEEVQKIILELQSKNHVHAGTVPASAKKQQERERLQRIKELVARLGRLSARHAELKAKKLASKSNATVLSNSINNSHLTMESQKPRHLAQQQPSALFNNSQATNSASRSQIVASEAIFGTSSTLFDGEGLREADVIDLSGVIDLSSRDDSEFLDSRLAAAAI